MIVALLAVYGVILFVLVKLGIIRFNLFWKVSPIVLWLVLQIALFIPMQWGAPQGEAIVIRDSVQIVPNVAGEVVEVPVEPNKPIKVNDVLFKIDPAPFEAQTKALEAQLRFSELRLLQMTQLLRAESGRAFDVEQRQAEVDQLKAQLDGARYNLEQTVVRAPADGYVTNIALRKGARVSNAAPAGAMAFIETSEMHILTEIPQNYARYISPGQKVELTFKFFPGQVATGKVVAVLQAISSGQGAPSGSAITPRDIQALPFVVRIALDDKQLANRLPAGATGYAGIFTDKVRVTHIIRRVILRQIAILNYVNPF